MDNYFILLELPFDPPVEDPAVIEGAIEQKAAQWKTEARSRYAKKKLHAEECLRHLEDIRAVMFNTGARRAAAAEARKRKEEKRKSLQLELALLHAEGGTLSREELEEKGKAFGPYGFREDEIRQLFEACRKRGEREIDPGQVSDWEQVRNVRELLERLQIPGRALDASRTLAPDLYDFLGLSPEDPAGRLRKAAEAINRKALGEGEKTREGGIRQKLSGLCLAIFKDEESKGRYDRFVRLTRYAAVNDAVDDCALRNQKKIKPEVKEELVSFAVRDWGIGVSDASVYIGNYCAYKGYILTENKVICSRCGAENPAESAVCAACGEALAVLCPACGQRSAVGTEVCAGCGFRLRDLERIRGLRGQAEREIQALDFPAAAAHLEEAGKLWPGDPRLPALRARMADLRQRSEAGLARLREAVRARQYVTALGRYAAVRDAFPAYRDRALEQTLADAVRGARSLCEQARACGRRDEVLRLCAQAAALCADLPDIRILRVQYPPDPPSNFTVKADSQGRGNALSWTAVPGGRPVHYVVLRGDRGPVRSPGDGVDGKVIFRGTASAFWDPDVEPGAVYWYNVFAEQDGVLSSGAAEDGGKVADLFEMGPVSVAPGDGSLRLLWAAPPRRAAVEVYLCGPGGERHLTRTRAESFLLTGLPNGVRQRFRVALSYALDGKTAETAGVTVSAMPVCPPDQVETWWVRPAQEDAHEAVWRHRGEGEVRLFASDRRPARRAGDVIPLAVLEQEMTALQTRPLPPASAGELRQGEDGAAFRCGGAEALYVTAASVRSGFAVFGPLVRVGRGMSAAIRDIRAVNGRIQLFLDAPREASGFAVLYRFDRFPTDPSDPQAARQDCTRREYAIHDAILLEGPEERTYYFTVFAWFDRDGEREWSSGARRVFHRAPRTVVTYAVFPARGLFGKRTVTLEFRADRRQFTLPETDVLSAVGAPPIFRDAASLLQTIPSQEVEGVLRVKIPLSGETPGDTYIKPVFRGEDAQAACQLRLDVRSNLKIT